MSVPHIDLNKARELAHEALRMRGPSYIYRNPPLTPDGERNEDSCYYVHHAGLWEQGDKSAPANPVCGCIVGYALHEAGIPLEVLREVGDESDGNDTGSMSAGELLLTLQSRGLLTVTQDARDYLRSVQSDQDDGVSWGVAVRKADERFSN